MSHYDGTCEYCGRFGQFADIDCNCSGKKTVDLKVEKQILEKRTKALKTLRKYGILVTNTDDHLSIYEVAEVLNKLEIEILSSFYDK